MFYIQWYPKSTRSKRCNSCFSNGIFFLLMSKSSNLIRTPYQLWDIMQCVHRLLLQMKQKCGFWNRIVSSLSASFFTRPVEINRMSQHLSDKCTKQCTLFEVTISYQHWFILSAFLLFKYENPNELQEKFTVSKSDWKLGSRLCFWPSPNKWI